MIKTVHLPSAEKITVSMKTAKKLKANGFNQSRTYFYWCEQSDQSILRSSVIQYENEEVEGIIKGFYSAPTTDELLEELPWCIDNKGMDSVYSLEIQKDNGKYWIGYDSSFQGKSFMGFTDSSLPEALAQMWLYLKKSNLLSGRGNEKEND